MFPLVVCSIILAAHAAMTVASSVDRDFHFNYSTDILRIFKQEKDRGNSSDPLDYVKPEFQNLKLFDSNVV
jgi:hypothetical protein